MGDGSEGRLDDEKVRKNRPVQAGELPDWAKAMPLEERERYLHSPHCKVCNAAHNGRPLRSVIEALVIERKSYPKVCDIMRDQYGLELRDYNIMNHMNKHAPNYAKVLEGLMESELGEVLQGALGPIVDQYKFFVAVLQVAWHGLLLHPEQVSVADGIRAAEKLHLITKGLDIRHRDDAITQEHITRLLDIFQMIMTPEQQAEVRRRFGEVFTSTPAPEAEELASNGQEEVQGVMVDGEFVRLDEIHTLPPEEHSAGD